MNEFQVKCPGCDAPYDEVAVQGAHKLIHKGFSLVDGILSLAKLPCWNCIALINYVAFRDCGHCCPESFADCPKCNRGKPTKTFCN